MTSKVLGGQEVCLMFASIRNNPNQEEDCGPRTGIYNGDDVGSHDREHNRSMACLFVLYFVFCFLFSLNGGYGGMRRG